MGGREAWARVRSYVIRAMRHEGNRAPFANTIWNDFAAPRVRIEAKGPDVDVRRASDGERTWRYEVVEPIVSDQPSPARFDAP